MTAGRGFPAILNITWIMSKGGLVPDNRMVHRVTRQDCPRAGAVMRKAGESPAHDPRSCMYARMTPVERSGHWGNLRRLDVICRSAEALLCVRVRRPTMIFAARLPLGAAKRMGCGKCGPHW